MIGYRFLSAAEEEAAESIDFYTRVSPKLAQDFIDGLDHAIRILRTSPEIGQIDSNSRTFNVRRFPSTIVYRVESDEIVIIALAHQSRKPGYWIDRV